MNFDSTVVGIPYPRIQHIDIDSSKDTQTATVEFTEQEHVKLANGTHRAVGSPNTVRFEITPADMPKLAPVRDLETGVPLGRDVSYGETFLGILAILRQKQLELAGQA
jgi:hypothetical protein